MTQTQIEQTILILSIALTGCSEQRKTEVCWGRLPEGYEIVYSELRKQYAVYHCSDKTYFVDGVTIEQRMTQTGSIFSEWIGRYSDSCTAKKRFIHYYNNLKMEALSDFKPMPQ